MFDLINVFFFSFKGKGGIKKSELIAWYLEEIEDEEDIDEEEKLLDMLHLVEKIIERLIYEVRKQFLWMMNDYYQAFADIPHIKDGQILIIILE